MAPHNPQILAALRRERAGYAARGLTDRVAQVDAQIARYGPEDDTETPAGRTAVDPTQQSADQRSGDTTATPETVPITVVPATAEDTPAVAAAGDGDGTQATPAADAPQDSPAAATAAKAKRAPAKTARSRTTKAAIPDASKG